MPGGLQVLVLMTDPTLFASPASSDDASDSTTDASAAVEGHGQDAASLRANEERLRLALELGGVGSFDWNLVTGEGAASKGCYAIFGYDLSSTPTYSNVLRVVLPEDLDRFGVEIDAAIQTSETLRCEFRIVRPSDGLIRWVRVDGGIIADDQGRAARMVGIVRDITERRQAHDREQILAREVDHRAKNLLTVVQSIVQLTRADGFDQFRSAVSGRIQALARAHSLLAASRWEGADLSTLVDEELAPFAGVARRIHVEGPPVKLRPAAAQSVALILHELITNAVKYGALSVDGGLVDLQWRLVRADEECLGLRWCERGGPAVQAPDHRGFGTTVIRASVERQLGGKLQYDWSVEGLRCDIWLPARQLAAADTHVPAGDALLPPPQDASPSHMPRVMVVEDEPLIALQIAQSLSELGCEIVGPAASVGEALELVTAASFDVALLDIDLNGARSFPIADLLQEQGRRFVFLSGFGAAELPLRFQSSPLLSKPLCPAQMRSFLIANPMERIESSGPAMPMAQGQLF